MLVALIGVVFDLAASLAWFPFLAAAVFLAEAVYCAAVGRRRQAAGWLVVGLGTFGGHYFFGRWGLGGGLLTSLAVALALRPDRDDAKRDSLIALQKLLAGNEAKSQTTDHK